MKNIKPTKKELENMVVMTKTRISKEGIEGICDVIRHWATYSHQKKYKITLYVNRGFANLYRNRDEKLDKKRKLKYKKH